MRGNNVVFLGYKSETHYRLEQPKENLKYNYSFKPKIIHYIFFIMEIIDFHFCVKEADVFSMLIHVF